MITSSNGREFYVTTRDSRHSSLIGRYQNALKEFFNTGNESVLKPFKNKRVKDVNGKWHSLETDPEKLFDIAERREDEEFFTIYKEEVFA